MTLLFAVRLWLIEFSTQAASRRVGGMEAWARARRVPLVPICHPGPTVIDLFFFLVGIKGGVIPMRSLVVTTPQRKCPIMLTGFKEPELPVTDI